jgi:GNAT superfamily N-acetyltransferase
MTKINLAETEEEIKRCFPVMSQLRPHLAQQEFIERVQMQQEDGYALAYLESDGVIEALAGYRYYDMLSRGRFMYVDDLITNESARSKGHGKAIFEWLIEEAQSNKCERIDLDSGVQRFDAHRFYFRQRMHVDTYHFVLPLE